MFQCIHCLCVWSYRDAPAPCDIVIPSLNKTVCGRCVSQSRQRPQFATAAPTASPPPTFLDVQVFTRERTDASVY